MICHKIPSNQTKNVCFKISARIRNWHVSITFIPRASLQLLKLGLATSETNVSWSKFLCKLGGVITQDVASKRHHVGLTTHSTSLCSFLSESFKPCHSVIHSQLDLYQGFIDPAHPSSYFQFDSQHKSGLFLHPHLPPFPCLRPPHITTICTK